MKLYPKSMCVTGLGRVGAEIPHIHGDPTEILHPNTIHSFAMQTQLYKAPDLTGFGSKLFYVSGSLIQRSIFDFIFSLKVVTLLLTSLKQRRFPRNHEASVKGLASIVIGSCINCGLNFIEFTQVLCWIVSKH